MDAKTQFTTVEQGCLSLPIEPTIEQLGDILKQLWAMGKQQESELQQLRHDFQFTVSRTLAENQELKWASHYSQSSGDSLSLEDYLAELDD